MINGQYLNRAIVAEGTRMPQAINLDRNAKAGGPKLPKPAKAPKK